MLVEYPGQTSSKDGLGCFSGDIIVHDEGSTVADKPVAKRYVLIPDSLLRPRSQG